MFFFMGSSLHRLDIPSDAEDRPQVDEAQPGELVDGHLVDQPSMSSR